MKTTIIYSTLTKPELIMGISKDSFPFIAIPFTLFLLVKAFWDISLIYIVLVLLVVYGILWLATYIDPFYFAIFNKFNTMKTKKFTKNKGNKYDC